MRPAELRVSVISYKSPYKKRNTNETINPTNPNKPTKKRCIPLHCFFVAQRKGTVYIKNLILNLYKKVFTRCTVSNPADTIGYQYTISKRRRKDWKKKQSNFYLTESTRQWIAKKDIEQKVSRSCYLFTLIKNAMSDEERAEITDTENWFICFLCQQTQKGNLKTLLRPGFCLTLKRSTTKNPPKQGFYNFPLLAL